MLEIQIKKILLDHLLNQIDLHNDVLISELPYLDQRRRADIALINKSGLHAYEIKGDKDNLDKVFDQINDYNRCFDSLTLVVTFRHLYLLKSLISKKIGLMLVNESEINVLKPASIRLNLEKSALLNFLTISQLTSLANTKNIPAKAIKAHSKAQLVNRLANCLNLPQARESVHKILKEKYDNRHKYFLRERGRITLEEDVTVLTSHRDLRLGK